MQNDVSKLKKLHKMCFYQNFTAALGTEIFQIRIGNAKVGSNNLKPVISHNIN